MKLKHKLMIAFIIMTIMPVCLISVTAGTIIRLQMRSINQAFDVETNTLQVITNPIQILNRITRGVFNEIKLSAIKAPGKLEDSNFYIAMNNELKEKYSFLAVKRNDDFIFKGDENKFKNIAGILPDFGEGNTDVDGGIYLGGRYPILVKVQDFYFTNGDRGSIYVITDLNTLMPQLKQAAIQSVLSIIIIIILTALILILWIYGSILKPLNVLKIAVNQMKDGNLDYGVSIGSKDEIGELCDDFEAMRTRLKALIDARLRYEVEIRELISNISHDLKTPLTAIKGYTEGLMDGVADTPEKQEKYLKTIFTKANDISILVDELSCYAMIDNDAMPYDFKDINLHEYFSDCMDELRFDLEVKNVKLNYINHVDQNMQVEADAEQLKRVINNIIGNSLKYLDKKDGKIDIFITDIGEYVQIDITDNGSGISAADIPYIFNRFYRADASRNSKESGSGLGLAISKKIIEEHGGQIWAESTEGKGTTIRFTLKKYMPVNKRRDMNEQDTNH